MLQTPNQPSHATELALVAGFILLLIFEALFVPAGREKTRVAGLRGAAAAPQTGEAAPPLPIPAP